MDPIMERVYLMMAEDIDREMRREMARREYRVTFREHGHVRVEAHSPSEARALALKAVRGLRVAKVEAIKYEAV